jgi:hypothetical protein
MVSIIAYIIFMLVAVAVVYWAVDALGTPDPLNRIVKVGIVAIGIIVVVLLFMQLLGVSTGGLSLPKV